MGRWLVVSVSLCPQDEPAFQASCGLTHRLLAVVCYLFLGGCRGLVIVLSLAGPAGRPRGLQGQSFSRLKAYCGVATAAAPLYRLARPRPPRQGGVGKDMCFTSVEPVGGRAWLIV